MTKYTDMDESRNTIETAVHSVNPEGILQEALEAGRSGDYVHAFQLLQDALRMHPDSSDILFNLALVLKQMGRADEAKQAYERVLDLQPQDADAMYNLANLYNAQGARKEASHWYEETLRVVPDHVGACNNLGALCESVEDLEGAVRFYRKAIEADPAFVEGLVNLGSALSRLGRGREAEGCCLRALALNSTSAEAHNNLAGILRERGELTGAQAAYRRAIALRPGFVEAMNNLGLTLHAEGRIEEEIDILRLCLEARPDYADAHHNLAIAYFTAGNLEEGWAEYEWRFHTARQENPFRSFDQPCWDGTPISGKRILLHAEQGLGDTIQFVRYAGILARQGATVDVECQQDLVPLLAHAPGVTAVVARGDRLPPFDVHCPLLSVPRRCKTTLRNVPAEVPYLHADPVLVEKWRSHVNRVEGCLQVGIVWAGNPTHPNDRDRSLNSALVDRLFVPGVRFYTLQRGEKTDRTSSRDPGQVVVDLGPSVEGLSDIAAILEHLDLIVAVDTAAAHLAGAMGKPVWLLLSRIPDWRWMLDRPDSPWYPTMRLFRQAARGDWESVSKEVQRELAHLVSCKSADQQAVSNRGASHRSDDEALTLEQKQRALRFVQRGLEFARQAKFSQAESAFREALTADPACAEALGYLGRVLRDRGDLDGAEHLFLEALTAGPDAADLHVRIAEILAAKHEYAEARHHLVLAASLQPNEARILTGFGDLSFARGQLNEARVFYGRALDVGPTTALLCTRMGNLCRAGGATDEARIWYERALQDDPQDADAHWDYAQLLLLTGQYEQGWKEYEWRWKHPRFATAPKQFPMPQWNGEPLHGKKILIHAEQGFGDVIQFIRYAPVIAATGAEVYAGIPPELARLARNVAGIRAIHIDQASVPPVDFHCPLLGVPRLLRTTFETIPFEGPYIHADNEIVEGWKHRLGDSGGLMRIGVAWAGSRHHENDRNRSCTLNDLAPLWKVNGVSFVSLQKDAISGNEALLDGSAPLLHFETALSDFAETAGLIACLDLVISTDTAVAHLAGAMGKRVWTLLPFAPEWRWGLGQRTTPWYPSMALYRQSAPSAWGNVVAQVVHDIQRLMQTASH